MKLPCLSLVLLLLGDQMSAADGVAPIIIASHAMYRDAVLLPESKYGKAFLWQVSPEKWQQTPSWTPGAGPVPLDAHAAAVAMLRWIKAQPWASSFERIYAITLSSHLESSSPANPTDVRWYYQIKFRVKENTEYRLPTEAIILLDGTVVEPTLPPASAPVLDRP